MHKREDYLASRLAPVTALLRIDDAKAQLSTANVEASLQVFNAYQTQSVDINGERVPLEVEPTAALAYGLSKSKVWGWELRGFIVGDLLGQDTVGKPLAFVEPYVAAVFRWSSCTARHPARGAGRTC